MSIFKKGKILQCSTRTWAAALFLMVIEEEDQTKDQFKAVVLIDMTKQLQRGDTFNNWNKMHFRESEMLVVFNLFMSLDYKENK